MCPPNHSPIRSPDPRHKQQQADDQSAPLDELSYAGVWLHADIVRTGGCTVMLRYSACMLWKSACRREEQTSEQSERANDGERRAGRRCESANVRGNITSLSYIRPFALSLFPMSVQNFAQVVLQSGRCSKRCTISFPDPMATSPHGPGSLLMGFQRFFRRRD